MDQFQQKILDNQYREIYMLAAIAAATEAIARELKRYNDVAIQTNGEATAPTIETFTTIRQM
jgi:hypothetical protein